MFLRIKPHITLLAVILFSGCAYYNTFYNAQEYYNEAEKLRLEKDGESIPISAMDKYGKTIVKCQKVIEQFSESSYVDQAFLLMGKSRYYRSDYEMAINNLNVVIKQGSDKLIEEAKYWRSLCKWKKGSVSAALDELNELLDKTTTKNIKAKCFLSLAEIAKETKDLELSLFYLQEAAKLTVNRNEKGVIYGRLSEMAFNKEDYTMATDGYNNVISHSLSKDKIENAHLQILKILRLQKNYRSAQKKIKAMLLDDKFSRIAGELELELVQLYKAQGDYSDIESRLEIIVNDYQRTTVSAEAYYQLGRIYTSEKWDLEKAREYFEMVSKESSRSIFSPMAKNYSKAIEVYQNAVKDLEILSKVVDPSKDLDEVEILDSTKISIPKEVKPKRTQPELYYQLADLEAFTFDRYQQSTSYLNMIIEEYPDSPFRSKSLFALVFVHEALGDTISSVKARNTILTEFSGSDYAMYLSDDSTAREPKEQEVMLKQAELEMSSGKENAIDLFKSVMSMNLDGDYSVSAAYTIGYYYDQEAMVDSALKYYSWIKENYPDSDQSSQAISRMNTINFALSSLEADTVDNKSQE